MKIIDRNGRLFGKISVIDVLVIAVVLVMAAALFFKSNQTHTGTSVTSETITYQMVANGVRTYVADAVQVGDLMYDQDHDHVDDADQTEETAVFVNDLHA